MLGRPIRLGTEGERLDKEEYNRDYIQRDRREIWESRVNFTNRKGVPRLVFSHRCSVFPSDEGIVVVRWKRYQKRSREKPFEGVRDLVTGSLFCRKLYVSATNHKFITIGSSFQEESWNFKKLRKDKVMNTETKVNDDPLCPYTTFLLLYHQFMDVRESSEIVQNGEARNCRSSHFRYY